ncbi:MAG: PIN domain-containing protein [Candidatus Hydrogenedentes bacterium]|nr:PIN domain-containing protein [Candidatus Hydrogenedentota bacterium]
MARPLYYLDSNVFIYNFEDVQIFSAQLTRLFQEIREADAEICTSLLTLSELLVKPLRSGDQNLVARYRLLFRSPHAVRVLDLDEKTMLQAAELRSRTALRLPDALHLASAQCAAADYFVTGDRRMRDIDSINVRLLQELC